MLGVLAVAQENRLVQSSRCVTRLMVERVIRLKHSAVSSTSIHHSGRGQEGNETTKRRIPVLLIQFPPFFTVGGFVRASFCTIPATRRLDSCLLTRTVWYINFLLLFPLLCVSAVALWSNLASCNWRRAYNYATVEHATAVVAKMDDIFQSIKLLGASSPFKPVNQDQPPS